MELGLGLTKIIPMVLYLTGCLVIVLIFLRIEIGIYFIIPCLALQNILDSMVRYPLGKDFIDILFLALIIKWLSRKGKLEENPRWRKPFYGIVAAIMVWTYICLWIGSMNLGTGAPTFGDTRFVMWKNFVMLPLLYLIVVHNIKDTKQLKIILVLMTLTMLFMDRNFYHNFSGKDTSSYSDDIRVGSTFSYLGPNETAVFYAQNTIIILCLFLGDPNVRHKVFFGITTAFNYYCLIFLFSRGGYLASLVSWMFLGFMKDRRVLVVLVLFLVFWRSLVPTVVQQRIDMSSGDEDPLGYTEETVITDHSLTSRFEMWEQAVDLIGQHPIQGYGYGTTRFVNITTDNTRQRDSLHNGYLELLLELGGIGMIIFLALYTMGIRYGWLLYRNAKDPFLKAFGLGFVGCVLAILSGNIAGSYLFYFNVSGFFWVNLALVVRGLELANQTKETESESQDEKKFSARSRKKQLKPKRTLKPRMPAVRVPSH